MKNKISMFEPVMIFSEQHHEYWRPNARGYTFQISEAWVLPLVDAMNEVSHCSEEKKIVFVPVKNEFSKGNDPIKPKSTSKDFYYKP